jgi:hypothetical protein
MSFKPLLTDAAAAFYRWQAVSILIRHCWSATVDAAQGPDDLEQPARVLRQPPRQQQAQQQPLPPPLQQQQGQAQAQAQAGGAGQDEGAVLQMYEVEEPDQHHHQQMVNSPVFYSPAGGFRTRSEFAARSAVSPGDHIRSWWQGGGQQQEQHIKDVCATESWRTGLMSQQPCQLPILQQQQQQHLGQNTSGTLSNTAAVAAGGWLGASSQQPSQPQAAQQQSVLAILQQLRQHVQLEGLPLLDSLGQQVAGESTSLAATSQQQLQQQQLQLQQQQQLMLQAAKQQPGLQLSGNPFGCLEPHIGSLPSTAAALGYRQDMGRSAQAMVALGDYIAARL